MPARVASGRFDGKHGSVTPRTGPTKAFFAHEIRIDVEKGSVLFDASGWRQGCRPPAAWWVQGRTPLAGRRKQACQAGGMRLRKRRDAVSGPGATPGGAREPRLKAVRCGSDRSKSNKGEREENTVDRVPGVPNERSLDESQPNWQCSPSLPTSRSKGCTCPRTTAPCSG